jgi:hypothetical protein
MHSCDGIWAHADFGERKVVWNDFVLNPHFTPKPLQRVPDIIFDGPQYRDAFAALRNARVGADQQL